MCALRGRCLALEGSKIALRMEHETRILEITNPGEIHAGSVIAVESGRARILTPNRTRDQSIQWNSRILDPKRLRVLDIRTRVEALVREFFFQMDFREVRTPLLVPCPGMEPHVRPFRVGESLFLPTSPEFAMKRLLVGGLEKIFQMNSAFRDEPRSVTHLPEFTMLEWYRAYAGYLEIMNDTERLFELISTRILGSPIIRYAGRNISVATPWPRLRVRDLFYEFAQVNLLTAKSPRELAAHAQRLGLSASADESWDDLYFKIWLNIVEPNLPADRAVFVMDYPPSQAALAVVGQHDDGSRWARRFEAYAGGLELCNAFEELTDPEEQRKRFVEDMALRENTYGPSFPKNPLDEEFLQALTEGMPPSGGNALGIERLIMLIADEPDIRYTQWLS